ncbi:hypothetical protein N0V83_011006 [Neocucurbitaria cava]|uniref:Ubiquitin-like protease family profile domain-containing protein n=1 Tax=Neocucurbitaria cava TaxID=798079 RepID=A0A9W8Y0G0_9PLEO|nr:hypothetical protein N0V83_011006 [Neocucurbitaria cava]
MAEGSKTPVEHTSAPAAPSTPGSRTSLTSDNFPARGKDSKDAHFRRGRIFTETRQMMRHCSRKMLVVASRGHQRAGHAPTKHTRPGLHKCRYSVDIITEDQGRPVESEARGPTHEENDPAIQGVPGMSLPNPHRYPAFAMRSVAEPPFNNDIYLSLGDALISNEAFRYMTATSYDPNYEAWMRDESLNMALETLRLDEDCEMSNIDIANSTFAQLFYFAKMCGDGDSPTYDHYRARFQNKRWIFVVVNNGIGEVATDGTNGSHWSLLVLDRGRLAMHYYDSLYVGSYDFQMLGYDIGAGLLSILGEKLDGWTFTAERHSPYQVRDNLYDDDVGPCGPVVYTMTKVLVQHIKRSQDLGEENECVIGLEAGFGNLFGSFFNSLQVRLEMQHAIMSWRCRLDAERLRDSHDQAAVLNEDVVLLHVPPEALDIAPRPPLFVQPQASQSDTRSSHKRRLSPNHDDTTHRDDTAVSEDGLLLFDVSDSELSTTPSTPTNADLKDNQGNDLLPDENAGHLRKPDAVDNNQTDDEDEDDNSSYASEDEDDET